MLTSLSLIFLVGLAMGAICQRLKLPRIIGMLVTGMVLGPYVLDFLDPSILSVSAELRKMALIIIPVSYTHLDVYKRQGRGRCHECRCKGGGSWIKRNHQFGRRCDRSQRHFAGKRNGRQTSSCLLYTSRCV